MDVAARDCRGSSRRSWLTLVTSFYRNFYKTYSNTLITVGQVVVDFFTVFFSFWLGFLIYTKFLGLKSPQNYREYLWISTAAGAVFIGTFKAMDLYKREMSLLNVAELRKIFLGTFWASFFLFGLSFYVRNLNFSRVTVTLSLGLSLLLVTIERTIFYQIHLLFHLRGISRRKILIYGAGEVGRHIIKRIYQSPALGMAPVGFIDDDAKKVGESVSFKEYPSAKGNRVLGTFEDLHGLVKANQVEEVIIAIPSATHDRVRDLVKECQRLGVEFSFVPHAYDMMIEKLVVSEIGGIPVLKLRKINPSLSYLFLKRILDFVVALTLLILAAPFYLLFGVLIKMDSPGPIIFKQKRVGLRGKEFSFYKFRTMTVHAEVYAETPRTVQDPRITKVGRWLRRSSLDELPQLLNVLRGDMSLVGPRPEMPFIVNQYNALQRERLSVKPGITGVWQISAVRGDPIHANLEYDLYYIENQSLLLDLVILLKTFFGVIRGIGAV